MDSTKLFFNIERKTTTGTSVIVPTNPSNILKSPNQLSCCNCSKIGHHSSNCKKYRWSQHFISPRFVTSYTKGPCYISDDATNEDGDGDTTIDSLNETINSAIEETVETSTKVQLFYEYSNVPPDEMRTWPSQTIKLSGYTPRHHIKKWKNEFIEPTFLRTQFPPAVNCQFGIQIDQLPGLDKYNLILKAASHECLVCLKKLMIQWLDRRETDDQLVMNNSDSLPWTKADLLEFLSKQLCQFCGSITARDIKRAVHILPTGSDIYKSLPEVEKERFIMTLHRTKREAVAFSYNHGLVSTAKSILSEFKIFMKQLAFLPIADNHPVPPDIYMSAVWFCFELFSPCLSTPILRSICKYDKRQKNKKKKRKNNSNQNEEPQTRSELLPEIFDEHEVIALFTEIKRAPKINPDPVAEVNTSAPVCSSKSDTTESMIDDVIQDIDNGSNNVTFLNEQMLSEPTAQTQSDPTKQKTDEKETAKVAVPKNTKMAAEKPKVKQKKGKHVPIKISKVLPKPRAKNLTNKSEILNYVYNASIHAHQNDLKSLIPRIDHMIDRAKLGLVVEEEIMGLWRRSRAVQKMSKGKVTIKTKLRQKKSLNPNPRKTPNNKKGSNS
ncbi:hypothetical protein PV325_010556 [Microctonus aethiopoides]|nr:hypothetical protein PV325_010556 [Microctonus aethiopoides]KAK0098044.1 hypothetical protein PV326_011579 [Microctonus aethiopoides]